MVCEFCGHTLIKAVDTNNAMLTLVDDPSLYGKTWGNLHNVTIDGEVYELVRPLLGMRRLHSDVCREKKYLRPLQ